MDPHLSNADPDPKNLVNPDRDEDPEFFPTDPDPAQLKKLPDPAPDPT